MSEAEFIDHIYLARKRSRWIPMEQADSWFWTSGRRILTLHLAVPLLRDAGAGEFLPEGELRIARQFTAGFTRAKQQVP